MSHRFQSATMIGLGSGLWSEGRGVKHIQDQVRSPELRRHNFGLGPIHFDFCGSQGVCDRAWIYKVELGYGRFGQTVSIWSGPIFGGTRTYQKTLREPFKPRRLQIEGCPWLRGT